MNDSRPSRSIFSVFGQRKMAALLLLGFSSGAPLFLTSKTLQAWMTVEGVDLATVGKVSWLSLPYTIKFLWAPLLDRYVPPFLGRRRGWLLISQVLLGIVIASMSLHDPKTALTILFINAVLISFLSATQDVAVDAYSVDVLEEREMGAGASLKVMGYRIAMILTGGIALVMADRMPWGTVYIIMAAFMIVGVLGTFMAPEPVLRDAPPASLGDAVVKPFMEFYNRAGPALGPALLLFIILYSMADRLVQNMANPFLLDVGYTLTEVGAITQALGLAATIAGVLVGGAFIAKLGINRSLWVLAFIQMGSNLAYYLLSVSPKSLSLLTGAILVENFSGGLVTAGFVAFMMSLCSRRFSATQYALLSSFMAFGRDFVAGFGGDIAKATGWPQFFLISIAAGIPALLMLPYIAPLTRENPRGAAEHTGETTDDPVPRPG